MNAISSIFSSRANGDESPAKPAASAEDQPTVNHAPAERDYQATPRREFGISSLLGANVDHMSGIGRAAPTSSTTPDRLPARPRPDAHNEALDGVARDASPAAAALGAPAGDRIIVNRPTRPAAPVAPMDVYDFIDNDSPAKAARAKPELTPDPPRRQQQQQQQQQRSPQSAVRSAAQPQSPSQEQHYEFMRFIQHRWVDNIIEIQVEWNKGPPTWEPEEHLQRDAPKALYEYWAEEGGRPANPDNPAFYNIYAILGHTKDRKKVKVQWTGYDADEATWEARNSIDKSAPEIVQKYFQEHKGKPGRRKKAPSRKRK